nr:hypothetical protein [Thiorhodococcus mannitoliphagus]
MVVTGVDERARGCEVLTEGREQTVEFGVLEPEQTVETRGETDVDVEAAGDVVHGDWRNAGDGQTR